MKKCDSEGWTTVIRPSESLFAVNIAELWRYRDLCAMFIRRDIVTMYKQTILGPLWFFIQPIMTMAMISPMLASFHSRPILTLPFKCS